MVLRPVEAEGVVRVDVVLDSGGDPLDVGRGESRLGEERLEPGGAGRVDGHQTVLVLDGEPGLAETGVDGPVRQQLAVAPLRQLLAVLQRVGEPLLLLQDQPAVIHASRGEQVDHGRLGAPALELRLERPLRLDGVAHAGRRHPVDVGGEHGQARQRPQGRHQDEAAVALSGEAQSSSR